MHLSRLPRRWNGLAAPELEEPALSANISRRQCSGTSQARCCRVYKHRTEAAQSLSFLVMLQQHLALRVIPGNLHISLTCSKAGWGCFPRQKFDSVQVAFRSIESFVLSFSCSSRGPRAPCSRTRSLHFAESPAMFPKAQTACTDTDVSNRSIHRYGKPTLHFW